MKEKMIGDESFPLISAFLLNNNISCVCAHKKARLKVLLSYYLLLRLLFQLNDLQKKIFHNAKLSFELLKFTFQMTLKENQLDLSE
jgi:hypothetical protein